MKIWDKREVRFVVLGLALTLIGASVLLHGNGWRGVAMFALYLGGYFGGREVESRAWRTGAFKPTPTERR